MNILQVSNSDTGGGAEGIAWNLFDVYQATGESSWLAVGHKTTSNPHVLEIPNFERRILWSKICLSADKRLKKSEATSRAAWLLRRTLASIGDPIRGFNHLRGYEDFRFPGTDRLLDLTPQKPQILHCHNLHGGYFDLRRLPDLSHQVPVVLTLHDAWLTTGHCAHSLNCERWLIGCGECPDLTLYPAVMRDATADNWKIKHHIYSRSRLFVATPSKWLMDQVERSMLRQAVVESRVIPNGIDLEVFKPGDRIQERERLGLPQDIQILIFAAIKPRANGWKDFATLHSAVSKVAAQTKKSNILFLAIGESGTTERVSGTEIRYIGPISEPETMAAYYRAADIYLHAARADTFPSSVLEAQACGIPAIATAVGGIPEQIIDGITGRLTPAGDSDALCAATEELLKNRVLCQKMGGHAAERVRQLYDLRTQTATYLDWYRSILSTVQSRVQ